MKTSNASSSAAVIAAHRAIESSKAPKDRICDDPLARRFIPPGFSVIGEYDVPEAAALQFFRDFVPGFHEYFLGRTRFIDDFLRDCLKDDLEQLVCLGAGYDSRAYRFDELKSGVRVFEVDHPDTQRFKQEKLREIFKTLPDHVTFVPLDFLTENLGSALYANRYERNRKTLFIWEGVTMYIDRQNVEDTFDFIGSNSAEGSKIILDYTRPDVIDGTNARKEAQAWLAKASQSNEPLRFGIWDDDLAQMLKKCGFHRVSCIASEYFNTCYFARDDVNRKATPIFSIAHAEVGGA